MIHRLLQYDIINVCSRVDMNVAQFKILLKNSKIVNYAQKTEKC